MNRRSGSCSPTPYHLAKSPYILMIRYTKTPRVGLEPTTTRLTAECSAIELLRNRRIRRRPMLPGRVQPSTFGTEGLNCCVRNGNRWNPFVIATGNGELFTSSVACASRLSHCSTFSLPCQALAFALAPSSAGAFPHPDNCTSNDSISDRFQLVSSCPSVARSDQAL